MTGAINGTSGTGISGQGRRRPRQPVPRTRRVELTLSGEEYVILVEAARRAGMARRAYAAQAALSVVGAWSDLDWDDLEAALDQIRHSSTPTPPIDL